MASSAFDTKTERFLTNFLEMVQASQNVSLNEARKVSTQFFLKSEEKKEPVEQVFDTITSKGVPLRLYIPKSKKPLPLLMFFHGGGWAFGSIQDADIFCRKLANATHSVICSVDYRLAPEHQFPIPLQDCYDATLFVQEHAAQYNADPMRIGVSGSSAGGNLAAAVALMARDKKELSLSCQLLLYPLLQNDLDASAFAASKDQRFMNFDAITMFWNLYLPKSEWQNPYACPLKMQDLQGLPPTMIITAEYDPMASDGILYAKQLEAAKVPTTHLHYEKMLHSFLELPITLPQKAACLNKISAFLKNLI